VNRAYCAVEEEPITSESCLSGELWQDEMIRSALIAEKPGSCAMTVLFMPLLLPDEDVSEELLLGAVVEPVVSVLLPEEPDEPEEPASAVVEDEPAPVVSDEPVVEPDEPEPEEPASAEVEDELAPVVSDEPVVEPDEPEPAEPASALVDDEPEPVVEFIAVLPEAA